MTPQSTLAFPANLEPDFAAARRAMVDAQLRTNAVIDPGVVAAMATVPREAFVPASMAHLAYTDRSIALGDGKALNAPLATARLLQEAAIRPGERVLIIGDHSGYTTALVAHLGGTVVGEDDSTDATPVDVIVVDGAVGEWPDALTARLKDGGRAVAGIVAALPVAALPTAMPLTRLASGRKVADAVRLIPFADSFCVILPEFQPQSRFTF